MHIARGKDFRILGFVMMPNHVHFVCCTLLRVLLSMLFLLDAKRFLAYDILAGRSTKVNKTCSTN